MSAVFVPTKVVEPVIKERHQQVFMVTSKGDSTVAAALLYIIQNLGAIRATVR